MICWTTRRTSTSRSRRTPKIILVVADYLIKNYKGNIICFKGENAERNERNVMYARDRRRNLRDGTVAARLDRTSAVTSLSSDT